MEQQNYAAKYAFYYMLSLVALIFMSLATGGIIFQIINKNIKDILSQFTVSYSTEVMKIAISALIISAPIYFLTMRTIFRNLTSGALPKESGIRKWLTYLILFVSSVVMLVWLIATINTFLGGDLTMKFILKAVTAIFIAASIFTFYYYDLKRDVSIGLKDNTMKIYLYGSLAIILAAFVGALFNVESPSVTRAKKFDGAILNDFNQIDGAIQGYYQNNQKLPDNLDQIKTDFPYITDKELTDERTGEKFDYKIAGDKAYELCATFLTSNKDNTATDYYTYKDQWPHDVGFQCLKKTIVAFPGLQEKMIEERIVPAQ